ncbi:PLAC8 family protein [Capsicum annuum]|nr:PLAC8 family protein [Capsicum annuum]
MIVLSQLACLCRIVACLTGDEDIAEAAHILTCISDMVYYSVCACMQTQHKIELDKRDGKFGDAPMTVPPAQHMSRLDQPYGPTVGYPPSYGAPYGQPQTPPQGYPAQAPGFPPPSAAAYPPGTYPPQQPPSFWR